MLPRKRGIEQAACAPKIAPGAALSLSLRLSPSSSFILYVCAVQSMLFLLLPALLLTLISTWRERRAYEREGSRETGSGNSASKTNAN